MVNPLALSRKERKTSITSRSLVAHKDPKSPIAEQYRTIRTNIQFSAVDKEFETLMVTSAGPGEGKSTTSANLAIVLAQQGKKVLLIDADLRKPTMQYTFHVENIVGLTNVLTHQAELNDAIEETGIENLHILTSGPIPPNPAELLGSKAMQELITSVKADYDLILFDTPPVLAVTDAQILSNQCEGVILVVHSGKTEVDAITKAKELLTNAKAKILGVVLNQKSQKNSNYYYYYGNK